MSDTLHPVHIDTRAVLRVYAALMLTAGGLAIFWGPLWFGTDLGGVPWLQAALIRILGSVAVAAGCSAVALGNVPEPEWRRQGLLWFAIGHGVVAAVALIQFVAIPGVTVAAAVSTLALTAALLLSFAWQSGERASGPFGRMLSIFGDATAPSTQRLRSDYERGIREAAAQEERHRLARDLHDSVKQQLFAIHTGAATAQARFEAEPAGAREALAQVRDSARQAMSEMEAMLHGLRAAPIENVGLVEALKQSCEALAFRTGAVVEFVPGELPPSEALTPGAQDAVFRVAQEAFANISRHARASHVRVTIGGSRRELELTIKDDGAGFEQSGTARGQGLTNMRARAAECGGRMEIVSQPGGGTRVRMSIPAVASDPADARVYGWRALGYGGIAFYFLMTAVAGRPWGVHPTASVPLLVLNLALFARELVAYFRTRKLQEARR
jgi:signal transduction histidine kinase